MLRDLKKGEIRYEKVEKLNKAERMLNLFLPRINNNIKQVYYCEKKKEKYSPVEPGTRGTVRYVNDAGQLGVT